MRTNVNIFIMSSILQMIKCLFGWSTESVAEQKPFDVQSRDLTPPKPKRPRLEMSSEDQGSSMSLNNNREYIINNKTWSDPNILKERWIRHQKKENIDTEARDLYKTFVLNKTRVHNASTVVKKNAQTETTSWISQKQASNDVICIDSDSEDDVQIIEPSIAVVDHNSSDSDVHIIEDIPKSSKSDKKRNSFLDENTFRNLQITEVIDIKDDSDVEEVDHLPQITQEQYKTILKAWSSSKSTEVITKFKITITTETLKCLRDTMWLNDEIINFYFNLIATRSENSKLPKVYPMNTFFLTKVFKEGQEGVKRWTRSVDIFKYDLIPIPYNQNGVHWCLIMINMKKKTVSYYDSLGSTDTKALEIVLKYVTDEYRDKKQKRLDVTQWTKINVQRVPQQMNGYDCGIFTCTIAEYLCRKSSLTFSQKDMPYFRKKICLEIIEGKLIT